MQKCCYHVIYMWHRVPLFNILAVDRHCDTVSLKGRTVTLKIKLTTFEQKTRAQSIQFYTNDGEEIYRLASGLLRTEIKLRHPKPLDLRLMGRQDPMQCQPRVSYSNHRPHEHISHQNQFTIVHRVFVD